MGFSAFHTGNMHSASGLADSVRIPAVAITVRARTADGKLVEVIYRVPSVMNYFADYLKMIFSVMNGLKKQGGNDGGSKGYRNRPGGGTFFGNAIGAPDWLDERTTLKG